MKKSFSLLLACALAMPAANISAAVAPYDNATQLANARADIANWMKYLPDDVFVAHVSIPGTHDTATAEGWNSSTGPTYSTTQAKNIDEQLANGIRAFDFRPGINGESGSELWCNHGTDRTTLKFADAMAKLTSYLDAHPSEFFVIHLFRGNVYNNTGDVDLGKKFLGALDSDAARENYNRLHNELFNQGPVSDYIIDYNPSLKVKDIRGKIVIFRRDRILFTHIEKAGNLTNWPADTAKWSPSNYVTATNATNPIFKGTIFATDVSSPDNETELNIELESITNLFNYNCAQTRPNEAKAQNANYKPNWSMIFTSGAYGGENTAGYLKNATYTNPHLTALLNGEEANGPTGIVFSDWVLTDTHTYSSKTYETKGVNLVTSILENNFKYIDQFILDDELFAESSEDNVDLFEGQEFYLRNVATGQFLSAGADWGTHAVTAAQGIRITPLFVKANNTYMLKTTFRQGDTDNFLGSNFYIDNADGQEFAADYAGNGNIFYFTYTTAEGKLAVTAQPTSGYPDGTEYIVNAEAYTAGNTLQQWELITEADLVKERTSVAAYNNGVDLSFLIRGNRFLPNDGENWTGTTNYKKVPIIGTVHASYIAAEGTNAWNDKELVLHCHSTSSSSTYNSNTVWSLNHKTEGLKAGVYKLSFLAAVFNLNTADTDATFKFTINGESVKSLINSVTSNDAAAAVGSFRNDPAAYTVEIELTLDENGSIEFDLSKAKTNSVTGFFLDNVTLTYFGEPVETIEYTPMDEYDTLILPFDHEVPAGLELFTAYGYTDKKDDYYVIELTPSQEIKANTPYVVKYSPVSRADATYTFIGKKASDLADTYTEGILTGSHVDTYLPANSFHLRRIDDANMAFARVNEGDSEAFITANRAYLNDKADEALNSPDTNIHLIRFTALNDDETGIENVAENIGADENAIVDIYTVAGVKVAQSVPMAEAVAKLNSGIYIIRANNFTVKIAK